MRSTTTSFSASGGTGTASVLATPGCQWTASDSASWITIQNGSGTGSGNFGFAVAANSGPARSANITVESETLPITQAGVGGGVDFSISDTSPNIGEAVVFTVVGSSTPKSWELGGTNCDSASTTVSCIFNPNLCKQITWRYASSGSKTVTYTDENNNEVSKTVAVGSAGSCPAPCDASSAPPATFSLSSDTVLIGEQLTFSYSGPVKASSIEGLSLGQAEAQTLALGITISPSSPQIGQQVLFLLNGLNGDVQQANWTFGGDGCGGEPSTGTCNPSIFNDCKAMAFKYASAGQKNVSVSLSTTGGSQNASTTVTVQNTGTCGGGDDLLFQHQPVQRLVRVRGWQRHGQRQLPGRVCLDRGLQRLVDRGHLRGHRHRAGPGGVLGRGQ